MTARTFPRPAGPLPRPIGAISRLARLVGPEAALTLAEQRGGTSLYVPFHPVKPTHQLAGLIGLDAANRLAESALIEVNARAMVKVPLAREWRVVVYRMAKLSYPQIALLIGIDENSVHRILQSQEMTNRQLDLFDRPALPPP